MKITQVVKDFEMGESQNQRDNRVEDLWRKLDPQGTGELDLKGLQKGLRRIDHPLKNADDLLGEVMRVVDTNRDGKIQYEEFRVFVEAAERQLLRLFKSIDHNHDGKLGQEELSMAFQKAGLAVPKRRLSGFFEEVDMNHDGFISFDEWRSGIERDMMVLALGPSTIAFTAGVLGSRQPRADLWSQSPVAEDS